MSVTSLVNIRSPELSLLSPQDYLGMRDQSDFIISFTVATGCHESRITGCRIIIFTIQHFYFT